MTSIATQISTINVPFHGDSLYLVSLNGEPHVPMKPVVEGMGLAWQPQHEKLKTRFSKGITEIVIPTKGGEQSMTCLAFRKFAGWIHTINVGKVRPELRDKVARYQEECDDVLYQYWTKGEAVNPRKKTTVDQRTPLRDAVNMLVGKKGLRYDDAYNMVHQRFAIDSIDELELFQIPEAVEYIHRVVLHGEFIAKDEGLIAETVKTPSRAPAYRYLVCMTVEDAISGRTEVLKGGANCATEIVNGTAKKFGIHIFDMMPVPTTPFC